MARSTPIAAASRSSASSSGVSTPAARSGMVALSSASRTGMPASGPPIQYLRRGLGGEPLALLLVGQRARELVQVPAEHRVEVVDGELDAMVGDPALGEVVRADLLRPL